jgi:16S rRNA (guanine527-N7)-methyltransferase
VADVGSGAGLPGLVLACVRPDLEIWLIESRSRRASFLLEVKARLDLAHVTVVASRAEALGDDPKYRNRASIVTARAVSLEEVVKAGLPLLRDGGRLLAMQAQTRSPKDVEAEARRFGLTVLDLCEYRLLGGEGRRIVVLARS